METPPIKAKTRQEVANEFGISVRTLYRWIEKAKIELPGGLIDPTHLTIIYQRFGYPEKRKKQPMS